MNMVLFSSNISAQEFLTPVLLSLRVAFIALIIVLILGIIIGRFMARNEFRGKIFIETVLMMPLVLPPTVVGFLLLVFFGSNSVVGEAIAWLYGDTIIFTWYAAVAASTVVAFPLMYQAAKGGFLNVSEDIENAARVDGANRWQVFVRITLPLARTALITGALLSFARALGEFGATIIVAGNIPGRTQTLPTAIYVALQSGNMTLAWAWVIVIVILSFFMLMFIRVKANES